MTDSFKLRNDMLVTDFKFMQNNPFFLKNAMFMLINIMKDFWEKWMIYEIKLMSEN